MICWHCEDEIEVTDKYVYVATPFDVSGEEGYRIHESCSFEMMRFYIKHIVEENIRSEEREERRRQLKKEKRESEKNHVTASHGPNP